MRAMSLWCVVGLGALALLSSCADDEPASEGDGPVVVVNGDQGPNNTTTTPVTPRPSTLDCAVECPAKLRTCSFPEEFLAECDLACPNLSQNEIACVKTASCADLMSSSGIKELCEGAPEPEPDPQPTPGNATPGNATPGGCSSTAARCEGNAAVQCTETNGIPVTTRTTCLRGCEAGACVEPVSETTITARHSRQNPVSAESSGDLITLLSFSSPISNDPDNLAGSLRVSDDSVTLEVTSPRLDGCDADVQVTLNRTELGFVISGTDRLPDTACEDFLADVGRNGITVTLSNVPELNSSNVLERVTLISR